LALINKANFDKLVISHWVISQLM